MNCNCIKTIEKNYTEAATKQLGVEVNVEFKNVAYPINDGKITQSLGMPIIITADTKGYKKGKEVTLIINYCPFCGTKC